MSVPGGRLPVAAVSLVTVAPAYRRRRLLTQMMQHQLEDVQRRGTEPVALLWASESLIYGRFGYGSAAPRLKLSGQTRSTAFVPQVDTGPGSVDEVTRQEFAAVVPALREQLLAVRPGQLDRPQPWWDLTLYDPEAWRKGASALRYALHFGPDSEVDGYALFRTNEADEGEVRVLELDAADPSAYAALWRYLLDLDLIRVFSRRNAPLDEPLRHLVADQRAITAELLDATYVRIVDLPAALTARTYSADLDLVLAVADPLLTANDGSYRLEVSGGRASVTRTRQEPDMSLSVRELGAIYLGGTALAPLHRAGLVSEHRTGAVLELAAAFSSAYAPFCPDFF